MGPKTPNLDMYGSHIENAKLAPGWPNNSNSGRRKTTPTDRKAVREDFRYESGAV